jgi:glutamate formiminotransferase
MTRLMQCVPNFSEGRDQVIIGAIADAIRSQPVYLLDIHTDADHHRTVMTCAGEPQAVSEATFRAAQVAVKLINLEMHQGVHPRIGAVDVVPFVPMRDVSMSECVDVARGFGQRVARELDIPVFLYEHAALQSERKALPDVRRGGYEGLRETITGMLERKPDYGEAKLGNAGAMIVGAREPLIAFNVYLDTADVTIARSIAMAVRESGGGLPHVRAIGVMVRGRAQVSMNLTDFRQTSLFQLMERLTLEASMLGVQIVESELVGLTPQAALIDCALEYLKLPKQVRGQTLEARVGSFNGDYREIPFG